jgi:hypothetical protein
MADPNSRRVGHSSRGAYILEAAMVVFGVAVFILGIADISRIFHARGAVRMGVTDGLRCLYPTDPNCQSTEPPQLAPPAPRFNAWVWGSSAQYESPRNNYRLVAQSYEEPLNAVREMESSIGRIQVEQPVDPYRDYQLTFPVSAYSPYLFKTSDLPVLGGSNPRDPIFWERNLATGGRGSRQIGPNLDLNLNENLSIAAAPTPTPTPSGTRTPTPTPTPANRTQFSRSFTVGADRVWAGRDSDIAEITRIETGKNIEVPCYQGQLKGTGSGVVWPPGGEPAVCTRMRNATDSSILFSGRRLMVPLMIHVTGRSQNMSVGSEGAVALVMSYREGSKTVENPLGGIRFSGRNGPQSFVVRGAHAERDGTDGYEGGCRAHRYSECIDYPFLMVPLDTEVTLTFTLTRPSGSGSVGWQGEELKIFFPTFDYVNESHSCESTVPNQCSDSAPPFRAKYHETNVAGISSRNLPGGAISCSRNAPTGSYSSKAAGEIDHINYFTRNPNRLQAGTFRAASRGAGDTCQNPKPWFACNYQFSPHLEGCGPEFSEQQKMQRCPITDYRADRDKIIDTQIITRPTGETDSRPECTGEAFSACSKPFMTSAGRQFLGWGPQSCSAAIPRNPTVGDYGSYFEYYANPGCPDVIADVTKRFKQEHGIPAAALLANLIITPADPLTSDTPPDDSCRIVRPTTSTTGETLCAENAPSWVVENCCRENNSNCRVSAAPSQPGSGSGTGGGFGAINLQPAVARAQQAVSVAYPPTRTQAECDNTGVNCLDVTAELANNNSEAVMRASMDVPLVLFSWLGGDATTTVAYEERRALERSLVGVAR